MGNPLKIMTVFAHPDDETFGCAGALYRAVRSGHRAAIVCATRGEAGEIADPSLAAPENLGAVREMELRRAAAAVGVQDVSFLGYIDGQLKNASTEEASAKILAHLRRFRPDVVITFAPNGIYGHPDHVAIHYLTLTAIAACAREDEFPEFGAPHLVRKVYYSSPSREMMVQMTQMMRSNGQPNFVPGGNAAGIPFEEMGVPETELTTRLQLTPDELAVKAKAMRCHATQLPPGNPFTDSSNEIESMRLNMETFALAPEPISGETFSTPEDDLFTGLN